MSKNRVCETKTHPIPNIFRKRQLRFLWHTLHRMSKSGIQEIRPIFSDLWQTNSWVKGQGTYTTESAMGYRQWFAYWCNCWTITIYNWCAPRINATLVMIIETHWCKFGSMPSRHSMNPCNLLLITLGDRCNVLRISLLKENGNKEYDTYKLMELVFQSRWADYILNLIVF